MNSRNWLQGNDVRRLSVGVTAADWRNITDSLAALDPKSEWLHLDVMDGQFCPKLTCGAWLIDALPKGFIIDAHVMTYSALAQAMQLAKNGAHIVTLQYEALENAVDALLALEPYRVSYQGNDFPLMRGISLCPETDLDVINALLPHIEMVQLLSLDPRSGEKMEQEAFAARLKELIQRVKDSDHSPMISVDGSMSLSLAEASVALGANIIVSGSALFKDEQLSTNLETWKKHLYR